MVSAPLHRTEDLPLYGFPPPSPWTDAGTTVCLISTDAVITYICDMCSTALKMWDIYRNVSGRKFKATACVLCPEQWMRRKPQLLSEIIPRLMDITLDQMPGVCQPKCEIVHDAATGIYRFQVPLRVQEGQEDAVLFRVELHVLRIYDVHFECGIYYAKDVV